MFHEASLCWICGGHTDQAVAYWSKKTQGAATNIETMQVNQGSLVEHIHNAPFLLGKVCSHKSLPTTRPLAPSDLKMRSMPVCCNSLVPLLFADNC